MKVVKVRIIKPVGDVSWADAGSLLRDIQYKSAKILNHCMTGWYFWQISKEDIKQQTGKYPTAKELPQPSNRLYAECRKMYPELNSYIVSTLVQKSRQRWQADCKDVFYRQDKSLPTFKKTYPIPVGKQNYRLNKTDDGLVLTCSLQSMDVPANERRLSVFLYAKKLNNGRRSIVNNIISGAWKGGEASIMYKRDKWFVNLTYEPPERDNGLDPDITVGVNLGIHSAFYCALLGSPKRLRADGWEIERYRSRVRKRRRSTQNQYKFSGRKGRGRRNALKPLAVLAEKERCFRDTRYHLYSKQIVEFAAANRAGVIVIEDFDSLKKKKIGRPLLADWAVADLQAKLMYKAAEAGIEIKVINTMYTSQRCFACGHIHEDNRGIGHRENFKCLSCGHAGDASYNAAQNIALPDIEDLISAKVAQP